MQIDDIESKKLLPNWAHDADWIQAAFDQIVLMCAGRLPAIDAPLTMQAIQCLTDEELREWYARFGVVEYYPDLNRETREKMLYWLARLYRFLGTPHAIRVLCDYIYNDLPLDVTVIDNLAFDGETLVDPTLLDLFDVEIDAGSAGISPTQAYRLVNNILRIARNSQTLRKIIYDYASDIDVNCGACSYGGDVCIDYSDNDELARDVTPPPAQYIEVMLNLSRSMNTVTFSANDYWASYAETTASVNALNDFGVPLRTLNNAKFISATALSDFSFEPVGLYTIGGVDVHADMSNFYCAAGPNNPDSDYGNNVNIYSINAYSTPVLTWKCRITRNS